MKHGPARRRPASPLLLAGAMLCFVLPFGTVSCSEDETVRVTGVQLATFSVPGATSDDSGEPNFAQQVEDEGSVLALVALLAALGGLAFAVLRPLRRGWPCALAFVALGALLLDLGNATLVELATVELHVGFIGTTALLTAVLVGNLVGAIRGRRRSAMPPPASESSARPFSA